MPHTCPTGMPSSCGVKEKGLDLGCLSRDCPHQDGATDDSGLTCRQLFTSVSCHRFDVQHTSCHIHKQQHEDGFPYSIRGPPVAEIAPHEFNILNIICICASILLHKPADSRCGRSLQTHCLALCCDAAQVINL